MILDGHAGARYDAVASSICPPSDSTIWSPTLLPQRSSPSTSTRMQRPSGLQMGSIFLDLPGRDVLEVECADRLVEPLDLESLHRQEGSDELLAELPGQHRVGLERIEGAAEIRRKPRARVGVVEPVRVTHHRIRW